MSSLLILRAASVIGSSGSIVTKGVVIISFAFRVSGLTFFAKTLTTRSRSVIMPIDFPFLLVTIMQPKSFVSIESAAVSEVASSSMVITGLVMTSLTTILVLNPISDIDNSLRHN